jgi:hypothetical protein
MHTRYLHYITPENLEAWQTGRHGPECLATFPSTAAGVSEFSEWLMTHRQGIHSILADLPDEAFHQDRIPPLGGHDRRAMIARKLAHQFHGSAYTTHISLGREASGRRDERVLLTGLTRPAAIDMWLTPLMAHEIALRAMHTPALLSHLLLKTIRPAAARGLLISFSGAGQRHVYFDKQTLCFARLSPTPDSTSATDAATCLREIRKTLQYLVAQRWIERNEPMPVWLLLDESDAENRVTALSVEPQLLLQHLSLNALSRKHGLHATSAASNSKALLIQLALNARNAPQLAPQNVRSFFKVDRIVRSFVACALLGFAALIAASLGTYREIGQVRHDLVRQETARAHDEAALNELQNSLPALPTSTDALLLIANIPIQHEARLNLPASALASLSRSLDRFPDVELHTLTWRLPAPAFGTTASALNLDLQATMEAPESTLPEEILAQIQAFSTDLKTQGLDIRKLDMPFNTAPDKSLQSPQAAQKGPAEFHLSLRFEPPSP